MITSTYQLEEDILMGELNVFTTRIKELRESLGMTQKDFSQYVGIKQQTLSGYERGIMKPPLDIVTEIARKCGISIDWLCGLSEKIKNNDTPETYADVIDLLVKVEKPIHFHVGREKITVTDDVLPYFLEDWGKMLPLFHKGTIDNKLYKLWLDDKKKEYTDIHLGNKDEITEFLNIMNAIGSANVSPEK